MTDVAADPFAVIETEAPEFAEQEVRELVSRHYGLDARLTPLLSERDQNFRLRCDDGREYVLKIANASEDPQATDFQIQALLYLASWIPENACPITVPAILPTRDDSSHLSLKRAGREHVVRVVTYVPGVPLGRAALTPRLCRRLGGYLAHLGKALQGFTHPASSHGLLWDMQQAPQLRRILRHIGERQLAAVVARTLDDFETHALPHFPNLRSQVIHSDLNPENVLVAADDRDQVVGVIDFGDMVHAPLIADVAIGASYMRSVSGDPLQYIGEFVAGYHAVRPLESAELGVLLDLIRTRLAASIAILAWRAALRGSDDAYLAGTVRVENTAATFLGTLDQLPRDAVGRTFRQVCAAVQLQS